MTKFLALLLLFASFQVQAQKEGRSGSNSYNAFAQANNFYGPGVIYGVDSEKNSYVLADLTKEADLEVIHSQGQSLSASFNNDVGNIRVSKSLIQGGFRDDLLDRVISLVAGQVWQEKHEKLKNVELQLDQITVNRVTLLGVREALLRTDFGERRARRAGKLHMYLVSETMSVGAFQLRFPNLTEQTLKSALGHLPTELSWTLVGPDTIVTKPQSPVVIAFRAISIDKMFPWKTSDTFWYDRHSNRAESEGVRALSFSLSTPAQTNKFTPSEQEWKSIPVPKRVPLAFTHFVETDKLIFYSRGARYGELFRKLQYVLLNVAGFNETRVYDSGTGFAIATALEVTDDNGQPLSGPERFLPTAKRTDSSGKRLRGFYITVSAHPEPTAIVATSKPEDLFSMDYGLPYLPDDMASVPTAPEITVRVFVVEFRRTQAGKLMYLRSSQCGSSAISHLLQAGILKNN